MGIILSLIDWLQSLIVKVLQKQISYISFRVNIEVYVYKNPLASATWSFSVKEAKKFKEIDLDLLQKLKDEIEPCSTSIEESEFVYKGIKYALVCIGGGDWSTDDGKYENSYNEYQLVSYDNKKPFYPRDHNIVDKFNVVIRQDMYRTGSYYSEYYYEYEAPMIDKIIIDNIPEITIPSHEEVRYKKI